VEQPDLRDMFKKVSKSVCTSTTVVPPDPFTPPSTSSAMNTQEDTKEDPDAPEVAGEGDTQIEYASDQLYNPHIGAAIKGQRRYHLMIWNI
jgi:hypothetical protein